ncbi:N-6 DNA methylase [Aquimarina sp. TRL1]|uniref:Eco57I restriction-modification methylase domain-containing protein n=1 Tax=Aquimarina sp. (strain TRL1) TaxID=2736252 RepID=UPI00158E0529|nr:N-6 DNA methylase [Aquimarina sp. TRL1]QKX04179.1 N-6 DNA methylase [Aquimarina sp. TRL1]
MKLSITYNKEKNGIELMFVPKLSDKILEGYLIDLGFKKSNSKDGMWYVIDRPSYNNYAKKLQEAFKEGIDPKTIKVEPSFDVDRNHIDHYQFSLVNIKTDDDKDETKGVDYVVFDDIKKTALDIATRFANAKYGSKLNSVSVSPRNFKRRARNAFDEGRIITGISKAKETDRDIDSKKSNEKFLEKIQIPIPEDAKYEASFTIEPKEAPEAEAIESEEKSKAVFPLSIEEESKKKEHDNVKTLHRLNEDVGLIVDELSELETDVDDKGIAFNIGNAKIELDEILKNVKGEFLITRLKESLVQLIDLAESMPKGEFRDRLVKISKRFGLHIGAMPKDNDKVLTTVKDIVRYDKKVPNVLIPKVINPPFDSGGLYIEDAKKIKEKAPHLLKVLDAHISELDAKTMFELSQMDHPNDYGFSISRSALLREWEKRGYQLFQDLGYPTNPQYPYVNIATGYGSVYPLDKFVNSAKEQKEWWHVVELYRPIADLPKALQFLDQEIENLTTISDTYTNPKTGKPKSKKEDKKQYRSLTWDIESFESSKQVIRHYLDLKKADYSAIQNQNEVKEVIESETTEAPPRDNFSNIIVPERVIAPFDKGYIPPEEAVELKEQFFYLFEYTYRNVHWASPVELFMFLQFTNLKKSGISLKNERLYRIWEKDGRSLFNQLRYPTDPKYPYINLEKGFLEILPLEVIISTLPDKTIWWSAVKHYRPIADISKALKDITEQQNILAKKLENYSASQDSLDQRKNDNNEEFLSLSSDITMLKHSRNHLEAYLKTTEETSKERSDLKDDTLSTEDYLLISAGEAAQIRKQFTAKGFKVSFTGKEAFNRNLPVVELGLRLEYNQAKLDEKIEKEFNPWISILEKEVKILEEKEDRKSKQRKAFRLENISALKRGSEDVSELVEKEGEVFQDELFLEVIMRAKVFGYVISGADIADFRDFIMDNLFRGRIAENYPDEPLGKMVRILIDDFFTTHKTEKSEQSRNSDYLDKVVAIMHDHYIKNERLSKKKIEAIKEEAGAPNLGALWEAVELSWLLWYKQIYNLPISFDRRLDQMIEFWNTVQPTYAYSDSSKELFKQYSTPCPIGAMVAEYTKMPSAGRTFEPSAGNGLLVLGADPEKTHVNEIDKSRRYSLKQQGFDKITHLNAAEPFPSGFTRSFDVVVTNPPFASWEDSKFDKQRWAQKYFNSQIGVAQHMRLEHFMAGLALNTLKDSGKAAIIIMGHVYFSSDGYIAKYKPFFNWLYRHYRVDDIINMDGYKLYNKQGAVTKTMLILINGRKQTPEGVAPTRRENPSIEQMVNTFPELWERIHSHIKKPVTYLLEVIITQLKIELGL